MINKEIIKYLKDLKENNYREWFQNNKQTYDNLKHNFENVISELLVALSQFDKGLKNLETKDCVFRIYKDVRFSKDKTPYKTNFGAFFVPGGKKSGMAGYYLHVEPGECFIGGGIYMPPSPVLKKLREEVYHNFDAFLKIVSEKTFVKHFNGVSGSKTTVMPKGYDKTFKGADYLKFKDYTVICPVTDEFLMSKDAFKKTVEIFKAMKPFNDFLNKSFES